MIAYGFVTELTRGRRGFKSTQAFAIHRAEFAANCFQVEPLERIHVTAKNITQNMNILRAMESL
jgi:hypothetical protein